MGSSEFEECRGLQTMKFGFLTKKASVRVLRSSRVMICSFIVVIAVFLQGFKVNVEVRVRVRL